MLLDTPRLDFNNNSFDFDFILDTDPILSLSKHFTDNDEAALMYGSAGVSAYLSPVFGDDTATPELYDFDDFSSQASHPSPAPSSQQPQHLNGLATATWPQHLSPYLSLANGLYTQQGQQMRTHQRALSNASSASFQSSGASPQNHPMSIQQYPSALPTSQPAAFTWDDLSGQSFSASQHLPTPVHTPKQQDRLTPQAVHMRRSQSALKHADSNRRRVSASPMSATQSPVSGHADVPPSTPQSTTGEQLVARRIPKFGRTMSDIYRDELYTGNPMSMPATSAPIQQSQPQSQPQQWQYSAELMQQQRLQGVNPMRGSLQMAMPAETSYETYNGQTAAAIRQQQAAASEVRLQLEQQERRRQAFNEPKTVSPRDAFPQQAEPSEEQMPSLFPPEQSQTDYSDKTIYAPVPQSSSFTFSTSGITTPNMSANVLDQRQQHTPNEVVPPAMPDFPAHLISMETTRSESEEEAASTPASSIVAIPRPADTRAARGTYSCTYSGCYQRFDSQKTLQQHKKEAHRSAGPQHHYNNDGTDSDADQATQNGPHTCTRINPQTGKPCNTQFSRPYDLTRHEDTIHAERKKVRCQYCNAEKLFSRADALTRHLRLVHPDVAGAGRHNKRRV